MLKEPVSVKELEERAPDVLREALAHIPTLEPSGFEHLGGRDEGVDFIFHVTHPDGDHVLACQVKSNGQPRHARAALLQLRNFIVHHHGATPVLIAPYLSTEVRKLCSEHGVSYLDLEGNCKIWFANTYIERLCATKSAAEKRELRSLFSPKAAAILRAMFRHPERSWRVADLSFRAEASFGQVSNVRQALLDREWAVAEADGLRLTKIDKLLDTWRDSYKQPGSKHHFYTTLHGSSLDEAIRAALGQVEDNARIALGSFSAAKWLSPYARTSNEFFYADDEGMKILERELRLSPAGKGGNVTIVRTKESGIYLDTRKPAPGIVCTSPVQTYLDLWTSGERGQEAAEQLRRGMLS